MAERTSKEQEARGRLPIAQRLVIPLAILILLNDYVNGLSLVLGRQRVETASCCDHPESGNG